MAERQFRGFLESLVLAMAAPVEQEVMPPLLVRLVLLGLLVVRAKWLFGGNIINYYLYTKSKRRK
jgi:hypothetical protein